MCIICNPPFNQCVSTNILKVFLKLLDKHFPKSSILHKIFNRNSIKVNYSCTQNHDMRILNSRTQNCLPYNCQKKEEHGVLQVSPPPSPTYVQPPPPLGLSPLPTSIDSPPLPLFIPHNSHFHGFQPQILAVIHHISIFRTQYQNYTQKITKIDSFSPRNLNSV